MQRGKDSGSLEPWSPFVAFNPDAGCVGALLMKKQCRSEPNRVAGIHTEMSSAFFSCLARLDPWPDGHR